MTDHECTCDDVARLTDRVTELEDAVQRLQDTIDAAPQVRNNIHGTVGAHLQAGNISNLTIQ